MKQCKQCGRMLEEDAFRPYRSRSKGIYKSRQGINTICKQCEAISNRVVAAQARGDEGTLDILRKHYTDLMNKGLPPVTAAPRRLLGLDVIKNKSSNIHDLLTSVAETEVDKHCRLIQTRGYASVDEAQARHKELLNQLKDDDRYAEITELLDDWYFE